jgi:hypothetical protein
MHMAGVCGRDSYTIEGMLDHSIRDPLNPSISPEFYGWIDQGGHLAVSNQLHVTTFALPCSNPHMLEPGGW